MYSFPSTVCCNVCNDVIVLSIWNINIRKFFEFLIVLRIYENLTSTWMLSNYKSKPISMIWRNRECILISTSNSW